MLNNFKKLFKKEKENTENNKDNLELLFMEQIKKFKEETKDLDYLRNEIEEELELNDANKEKNELLLTYAFKEMMKK